MCREQGGEGRSRRECGSPVVATMLLLLLGGVGIPRGCVSQHER
jgi:hypothetical protein